MNNAAELTAAHEPHLATLTGRGPDGRMVGARVCPACSAVLAWLPIRNARTKGGTPWRVPVRDDLGYGHRQAHSGGHTSQRGGSEPRAARAPLTRRRAAGPRQAAAGRAGAAVLTKR